jgi:hypothetical protein
MPAVGEVDDEEDEEEDDGILTVIELVPAAAAIGDASICMYAAAFAPALPPDNRPAAECGR